MEQTKVIADILDNARRLTRWYFSFLNEDLLYSRFELDGTRLNSAYWIAGHLAWTQDFVLSGILGKKESPSWVEDFKLGHPAPDPYEGPDFDALWDVFNYLHRKTIQFIRDFDEKTLDHDFPDTAAHFIFRTNRMAFYHLVRHEGYHCGQLGIICKLGGVETI